MFQVYVANKSQSYRTTHDHGALELGRGPQRQGAKRIKLLDDYVSRDQLRLDERADGNVSAFNLSKNVPVVFADGTNLPPGGDRDLALPLRMTVGQTLIELEPVSPKAAPPTLRTIVEPVFSASPQQQNFQFRDERLPSAGAPDEATLVRWFERLVSVQRAAAGSDEFYQQTARAVVDLVGLDCGMVLLRNGDSWSEAARYCPGLEDVAYSRTILERVLAERRTFYEVPDMASGSLMNVNAVVASPILSAQSDNESETAEDDVVGVVYGARFLGSSSDTSQFDMRPLDAHLVQVLAAATGAGLSRLQSEAEALRKHVQFEQFVSKVVARELDRDPDLLTGRDQEISVLFADVRNFTGLAEQLGAVQTCEMVRSLMDRLTSRLREFHGTTVSFLGDGLLAMWNAPLPQDNHALLACRTALSMLDELPELNSQWHPVLGTNIRLGIGINTGMAMVGNTGSQNKLHYGPLGHTVNLASRVEAATKQLRVPFLITAATKEQAGDEFPTRRICRVRVMGIREPVDLYEVVGNATADWSAVRDAYEAALSQFEAGQWPEAAKTLEPLLAGEVVDPPSRILADRINQCLHSAPPEFDPVWNLPGK